MNNNSIIFDTQKYQRIYLFGPAKSTKTSTVINNLFTFIESKNTNQSVLCVVEGFIQQETFIKRLIKYMDSKYKRNSVYKSYDDVNIIPFIDEEGFVNEAIYDYKFGKYEIVIQALNESIGQVSNVLQVINYFMNHYHNIFVVDAASASLVSNIKMDLVIFDQCTYSKIECDNIWITDIVESNVPSDAMVYNLDHNPPIKMMTGNLMQLINEECDKYIVCDDIQLLNNLYDKLSIEYPRTLLILPQMDSMEMHRILKELDNANVILSYPSLLNSVEIDGKRQIIGINKLVPYNVFINSIMRPKYIDTWYLVKGTA